LVRTPLRIFAVSGDPNAYLVTESTSFHGYLSSLGGTPELVIHAGTNHSWSNLNETETLDWLQTHQLVEPAPGIPVKVLADRNARWDHFTITDINPGQFSPFRWTV